MWRKRQNGDTTLFSMAQCKCLPHFEYFHYIFSTFSLCARNFFFLMTCKSALGDCTLFLDATKCSPDAAPPQTASFSFFDSSVLKLHSFPGSSFDDNFAPKARCTMHNASHSQSGWLASLGTRALKRCRFFCHCAHFHPFSGVVQESRALTCLWQPSFFK